ncbi:unnamed protein product [Urochloa decumbens]|uniref:F-box domain-containing protein n=1 Tax=Urochloa decumbens TaxID=240449 RepID=A0ABC9A8Z3_9POAL
MAAAAGIDGGILAGLPDDILVEVFSRVGSVKILFRLAATCRRWLRLFTDPAFLRKLYPGHGKGLLGFFPRQTKPFMDYLRMVKIRTARHTSVSPPTFVPAPGSPLGSTEERALTAFVSDDDGTFNYAKPLAARRGFVLMHLVPRSFDLDRMTMRATVHRLALCNPITGDRHVLPPLDCPDSRVAIVKGYAIVTAADAGDLNGRRSPSARFTFSQLLIIANRQRTQEQYLHSYSAATRSWRGAPTMCTDGWRFSMAGQGIAAVHRGAAHWLCFDHEDDHNLYKFSADLCTACVSPRLKLPVRTGGTPLLHVSGDGKLSITCVCAQHVAVWTQQDEEEGAWLRTQQFRLAMVMPTNPNDPPDSRRCFEDCHEFDRGSMLVVYRTGGVFVLDIEKEAMEKVIDSFPSLFTHKQHWRCVPYEMDLVEFFMCHLGGLLRRG